MAERTTYTHPISLSQTDKLKALLDERGFDFLKRPYTIFAAKKDKLNISVYEKGPKILVQGKGTEDFIVFILEPEILGQAETGYEEIVHPEQFEPHFGIDESGKGDFFGPLVIAGFYTDQEVTSQLSKAGVMDSKKIGSDARIRELADSIRSIPSAAYEVILIAPPRYNELYKKFNNLNRLLAWGHARTIENLCARRPECRKAISDQFANPRVLQSSLMERGKEIELVQRTKAESDPAVAAASILAREAFVNWIDQKSQELGLTLHKGASKQVVETGRILNNQRGVDSLEQVSKRHFKTFEQVIS